MRHVANFPHAVRDIETVWIPLSDGCRLAARLWLPEGAEARPAPAVLEYIPYRKRDFMRGRDESIHPYFAGHGYAALRVDMRGSGESDGILTDEYLKLEQDDALEVIAWIAAQPWCDGAVGMMGKSWGAYNALQVAARRPPALKAILPVMGTDDRFNECVHFSGGCLLNENFWWGCVMQAFNARPPDPEVVGEAWREIWLERLKAETFWPETWLAHPTRDAYWRHGSVSEDYAAIVCPVWFWGGWADMFRDTPFRLMAGLEAPLKVTVGPWAHLYPHEGAPAPAVGFLQEALRWWDHWLKGRDSGLMEEPRFRFWVLDSVPAAPQYAARPGRWIVEHAWPARRVSAETLFLNEGRLGEEAQAGSSLVLASPETSGMAGGEWTGFAIEGDQPLDQRLEEGGSLSFDGPVLEQPLEILGNAALELEVASDRPKAFVAARLLDVDEEGRSQVVTRGFVNLVFRDGQDAVCLLEPGVPVSASLRFHAIAYRIPAGHRLRLALSSAYWPILWPSPAAARLEFPSGRSRLVLPRRDPAGEAAPPPLPEPESARPGPTTQIRKGRVERTFTRDLASGETRHRLFIDGGTFGAWGKFRLDDIGMEMGHVYDREYRVRNGDPLSARASMTQTYEMGRGDWQVRIACEASMTADSESFHLEAGLTAYEGDDPLIRRDWKATIPRGPF